MIEDIKKEISNLTTFNGGHNRMHISDLFKILDKYKDKEDKYKNAWEELKKISQNKKLDKIKEFVNKSIRPEYRNGNSNEFYLEMNEKELKKFLSIIGGE